MAVASVGTYASLHIAPDKPRQHLTTQFFTGRMPFLPPNQQHQSTVCVYYIYTYRFTDLWIKHTQFMQSYAKKIRLGLLNVNYGTGKNELKNKNRLFGMAAIDAELTELQQNTKRTIKA